MKINQTIETMTLQQLQQGMMLHDQIREVERQLILVNNPGRLTIRMTISVGNHMIEMERDEQAEAVKIKRIQLEEKLKMLKRKFNLL